MKRAGSYELTETRQRNRGREEEGECPLQRGQKTLTAVTLTLSERDRGKKNTQKKAERAQHPVSDATTDGYYYTNKS